MDLEKKDMTYCKVQGAECDLGEISCRYFKDRFDICPRQPNAKEALEVKYAEELDKRRITLEQHEDIIVDTEHFTHKNWRDYYTPAIHKDEGVIRKGDTQLTPENDAKLGI